MDKHLRELLEKATSGELREAEAMRVIADARRSVLEDQTAYLRDLNRVVLAEEALRTATHPEISSRAESEIKANSFESYCGVEIEPILLGVYSTYGDKAAGLRRYKCVIDAQTFICSSRDELKRTIDSELGQPVEG